VDVPDRHLVDLVRRDWYASSGTIDDADWTAIVERALHHGVASFVCRALVRSPAAAVAQIVDAAAGYLESAEQRGATALAQLADILDALERDGIAAIPFKGAVLGAMAHASASVRESRDIDVLVHRGDMSAAVASLRRLGYRPDETFPSRITDACYESYGQDILFADGRLPVEPHCAFAPRALCARIDMDGVWRRARPFDLEGRQVCALSLEDTLLLACLHGSKEKWWRLLWVADVAALIHRHRDIDWEALLARASTAGIRRMVLLGVALARELFESSLPPGIASMIDEDRVCGALVAASVHHLFAADAAVGSVHRVSSYHLRARERIADRVRYVWRTTTTPQFAHYRMLRLPDALTPAYVPLKIVHDYVLRPVGWSIRRLGRSHESAR
jgi:hypothetical protein